MLYSGRSPLTTTPVAHGADQGAIAAALPKIPAAGAAHVAAFAPAVELRLRALFGEEVETLSQRPWRPVVLGALVLGVASGALPCLAMLDPVAELAQLLRACCLP